MIRLVAVFRVFRVVKNIRVNSYAISISIRLIRVVGIVRVVRVVIEVLRVRVVRFILIKYNALFLYEPTLPR